MALADEERLWLTQQFDRLEQMMARSEQKFERLDEKIERLEQKFALFERHIERLDEKIGRLEQKFALFEHHIERLDEKIERVETSLLSEFHKWASPAEMRARSHAAAIRALDSEVEALADRVAKLEPPQ